MYGGDGIIWCNGVLRSRKAKSEVLWYYHNEIARADRQALAWVDKIPVENWTQSHDDGRRWGHMTVPMGSHDHQPSRVAKQRV